MGSSSFVGVQETIIPNVRIVVKAERKMIFFMGTFLDKVKANNIPQTDKIFTKLISNFTFLNAVPGEV